MRSPPACAGSPGSTERRAAPGPTISTIIPPARRLRRSIRPSSASRIALTTTSRPEGRWETDRAGRELAAELYCFERIERARRGHRRRRAGGAGRGGAALVQGFRLAHDDRSYRRDRGDVRIGPNGKHEHRNAPPASMSSHRTREKLKLCSG